MNDRLTLQIKLLSDATFGRGDGVSGVVDTEIEYDSKTGLPFIRGRTVKGLLVEECANILFALEQQKNTYLGELESAASFLFGNAGSTLSDDARMHVGPAQLPEILRQAVTRDVQAKRLDPAQVFGSLTDIRRQTAMDDATEAPQENSLRSGRVLLRDTVLTSEIIFDEIPSDLTTGLLAACVIALRRGGIGRNRGRGRLAASLIDPDNPIQEFPNKYFRSFESRVKGRAV